MIEEITINVENSIKTVIYQSVEFEHLKAFLNDYIHDKYEMWIDKGNVDYIVINLLKSGHPYSHHSFSNCVEWVFKNCEPIKEEK